jgi:mannose-1-phosphate guanylyltransferase
LRLGDLVARVAPPSELAPEIARAIPSLIVLAGGAGRRLLRVTRSLTGNGTPKQFCRFSSGKSLLEDTIDRTSAMIPADHVTVVVTGAQARVAKSQLGRSSGATLIVQPNDRGTAPGLLLPLLDTGARNPEAVVVVTPSDHAFADVTELNSVLRAACTRCVERPTEVVLIGARPDEPRTDFGWIVSAVPVECGFAKVARFEEKPPQRRAAELMAGGALFNTLIMVAKVRALLELFRRHAPAWIAALESRPLAYSSERSALVERVFASLPTVDLSRDILACADNLVVRPLSVRAGWTDLGDESRLFEWMAQRGDHEQIERIRRSLASA